MYFAGSSVISIALCEMRASAGLSPGYDSSFSTHHFVSSGLGDLQQGKQLDLYVRTYTCPLDSACHLEAIRDRKQGKTEYLEIVSEFQHVGIPAFLCDYGRCSYFLKSSLVFIVIQSLKY